MMKKYIAIFITIILLINTMNTLCFAAEKVSADGTYMVGIYCDTSFATSADALKETLRMVFDDVKIFTKEDMANSAVLNINALDCLVLLNKLETDESSLAVLMDYLKAGGDLLVAGEDLFYEVFNTPDIPVPIYESYQYEPYNYDDGTQITKVPGQDILSASYKLSGTFSGTTAVAYTIPCESEYIPILETKNMHGQKVGYAAGVLTNYYGTFNGGNWLVYGVAEPGFYNTDMFKRSASETLQVFSSGRLAQEYNREEIITHNKHMLENFEITEPAPTGFVHVREDGKCLLDGENNELFLVGASVFGPSEYLRSFGSESGGNIVDGVFGSDSVKNGTFSVEKVENLFKRAHDAGINCFRWWYLPLEGKAKDVIIQMARKYNIYIYAVPEWSAYLPNLKAAKLEALMKAWGDEPMFIGVDLWNEPTIPQLLLAFGGTEDNPIMDYDLINCEEIQPYKESYEWLLSDKSIEYEWVLRFTTEEMKKQMAAAETLIRKVMFKGTLSDMAMGDVEINPDCPEWIIEMVGKVIEKGLKAQTEIVRKYSDHALVTLGYFSFIAMWPNNTKYLDFWNAHVYTRANNYEDVMKELTTFDRLDAIDEPKTIPAILGEFCHSDGYILANGEMAKYETSGAYNFLHWLYAYANGFGGAVIWGLDTWNPIYYRYNDSEWNFEDDIFKERSAIMYYDGNPETKYSEKPAALATAFFKKFTDTHNIGDGTLEIVKADTQSGTGYVFTADTAEYVHNTTYSSERLQFKTIDGSAPIVMLDWSSGNIDIMATQTVTIRINPSEYISDIKAKNANISGLYGGGNRNGSYLTIDLLEGEIVTIKAHAGKMICTQYR